MHTRLDGLDGQRTLRILVLAPISLLLLTIVVFSVAAGSFNDSISAYYGGPARDVFVGCLLATSLGLVAFRGTSDLEDLALNLAGFYAPFVAFVPYDFASSSLGIHTEAPDATMSLSVILLCYLSAALGFAIFDYAKGTWAPSRLWQGSAASMALVALAVAAMLGFLGLVAWRLLEPGTRFAWVHMGAAILLIASLAIAVASHLVADRHRGRVRDAAGGPGRGFRRGYLAIAVSMAMGGPLLWAVLAWAGVSGAVLWTETWELALFIVFWALELRRHWRADEEAGLARVSSAT